MTRTFMDETEFNEMIRMIVREELAGLLGSSQYQFQKGAKFYDGRNIQVGFTTGTIIATDPNQKLGFFGAPPVVQPSTPATTAGVIALLQALGLSK